MPFCVYNQRREVGLGGTGGGRGVRSGCPHPPTSWVFVSPPRAMTEGRTRSSFKNLSTSSTFNAARHILWRTQGKCTVGMKSAEVSCQLFEGVVLLCLDRKRRRESVCMDSVRRYLA